MIPFKYNRHLTSECIQNYTQIFSRQNISVSLSAVDSEKENIQYINIIDSVGKEWCKKNNIDITYQEHLLYSLSLPN